MKRLVKVALATLKISEDISTNQRSIVENILKAAGKSADIIVFPEFMLYSFGDNPPKSESSLQPIREACKGRRIWAIIPANVVIRGKLRNRAYLINRDGEIVGRYDKCHGFEDAYRGSKYPVFQTDFGKIGIVICYDLAFEESARKLANKDAEIIFAPMYSGRKEFLKCTPFARAHENKVFVAVVNAADEMPYSCACSPIEKLAEYEGDHEELVFANINLDQLSEIREFYREKSLVKKSAIRKYRWLKERG